MRSALKTTTLFSKCIDILLFSSVIPFSTNYFASCTSEKVNQKVQHFKLYKDIEIPAVGLGTWQANDDELEQAVEAALEAGYRHIDTAHAYENEKVIGKVIKRWIDTGKLTRKDIFLVTKVPPGGNRAEGIPKYLRRSLDLLQVNYVDLYLVHVPFGFKDVEGDLHPMTPDGNIDQDPTTDHLAIWKAMEEQVDKGLAKSIGLSNFNMSQITRVLNNARIPPCNLQIELHAYNQQNDMVDFCKKHNMTVTAYSPLGSPGLSKFVAQLGHSIDLPDILGNPTVKRIAQKHNKTPAQILLRHTVQRGIVVIPKSTNADRLKQNINIFDFKLSDQEMDDMNKLDQKARILDFSVFKGIKTHPEYPFKS